MRNNRNMNNSNSSNNKNNTNNNNSHNHNKIGNVDQERIEECIDELYAIQKKTGERMIDFSEKGKSLIERIENEVKRYKQEVTFYSIAYFWGMVASSVMIIGVSFWLYYSFQKKYDKDIAFLDILVLRVEKVIDKQNELLKELGVEHNKKKIIKK